MKYESLKEHLLAILKDKREVTLSFRQLEVVLGFEFPNSAVDYRLWWIKNDIHVAFQDLLKKHGGHLARNDNSTHHEVRLPRIRRWESCWSEMAL